MAVRFIRVDREEAQSSLAPFPEHASFVTPYESTSFPFGSLLSSQKLNDMQARMQDALQSMTMALAGEIDWIVVKVEKNELEAVFSEDVTSTVDHNLNTFYSDRHGAQAVASLPNFPSYTFTSDDTLYFASNFPFTNLTIDLLTAASLAITVVWEYWDTSTGWTALSGVSDGTTGFTTDGSVSWTDPEDDWEAVDLDTALSLTRFSLDTVNRYWVRVRTTSTETPSIVIQQVTIPTPLTKTLKVDPTNPLSKSVLIYPGIAVVNGRVVMVQDFSVLDMSTFEPGADNVYVAIQLDDQGVISGKAGAASASAKRPEPDQNAIVLAYVLVQAGFTQINTPQITDTRIYWDDLSDF